MPIRKPTILRDALYNAKEDSGASEEYARGVVVGVVSALMAQGYTFDRAFKVMRDSLPHGYRWGAIPDSWLKEIAEK